MEFVSDAAKNDPMLTDAASLLVVSSELFGKYDIITLPESANYDCQDMIARR